MNRRLGLWALAGLAVGFFWVLVVLVTAPPHYNLDRWTVFAITAPASVIHKPFTWYEFIVLNAVIYSLIGLALEPFRHILRPSPIPLTVPASLVEPV